jgi:coniferyl-aldehyde dehydrogenase
VKEIVRKMLPLSHPSANHMDHLSQKQQLNAIFTLQQKSYALYRYPEYRLRKGKLKQLLYEIVKHEEELAAAVSRDFGHRCHEQTWISEIFQITSTIRYVVKNLRQWMKKHKRHTSLIFQPARSYVCYQPLGVVGIMVPWNYPILLSLSPLVYAIAAGNRVCIKMSEFTPHTNAVIRRICQDCFTIDEVAVITGKSEVAQEFSQLPFDHLFFTGSTRVAKKVMQAAALNLTPVTLELGGKSPLIIDAQFPLDKAAKMIAFAKGLNAGQTCIAPDYVFIYERKLDDFVCAMKKAFNDMYQDFNHNKNYGSIINQQQFDRLQHYLIEAKEAKISIIPLSEASPESVEIRKFPLTLLVNPGNELGVMQEEIFGPLLPVLSYKTLDEVVSYINRKPKPLACYLFSHDKMQQECMTRSISSGGMCINDLLNHIAQHDLPFGGVGASGMGRYHGFEGFQNFSNVQSIFQRGRINTATLLYPPYGRRFKWFKSLFGNG